MPGKPAATGDRLSPADLTPDQRRRYETVKARAIQARAALAHKPGIEELLTPQERADAAPFYFTLRDFIRQLKEAREAAGMTLADVADRTGLAVESLCRLETGAQSNPTWKTLGLFAAAVGRRPQLTAETIDSDTRATRRSGHPRFSHGKRSSSP